MLIVALNVGNRHSGNNSSNIAENHVISTKKGGKQ